MSDLLQALVGAGVDNLQRFPATLHDPFAQRTRTDYEALYKQKVAAAQGGAR